MRGALVSLLHITLFGPPRVECDGIPVSFHRLRTLALLAYLAAADLPHGRAALATLLWPEQAERPAHAALRRILYDLGGAIGKECMRVEDHQVALPAQASLDVDVRRFSIMQARVAAHGHVPDHLCDDCLAALSEAAGLYRDDFLAGFTLNGSAQFDAWQTLAAETLRLELAAALKKLAGALLARRRTDQALPYARRWLALDPLNEPSHRLLMRLYAAIGDRAALIRQYEQCRQALAAELGVEPAPQTTALYRELAPGPRPAPAERVPASREDTAARSVPATPSANLPADPTPFVGRESELAQVVRRLADPNCRLLTVTGPGGIGKTRLAIQAARGESARFAHGIHFVDLAPVLSVELLSAAILRALQAALPAGVGPDQHLLDLVRDKQMLLVLDNYEHLLTGPEPNRRDGYGLITRLAETAPQLKLLVTSRARLNVAQEWLQPLEGLPAPPPSAQSLPCGQDLAIYLSQELAGAGPAASAPDGQRPGVSAAAAAQSLRRYGASALFLACVRRVRPGFRPNAAEARAIAHICCLLEGTPLAIELAAAWTRLLPLAEVERNLEQGLGLLTSTLHGGTPRQHSMAATFDQSWRLLTPRERSLLRQLAVFRGGFSRDAALAVAGAGLVDLASLADASWLRLAASGRYAVHELIRQYSAQKLEDEHLAETGEAADQVRQRHAGYIHALLATLWEQFFRRKGAIPEITPDLGNLLAAWDWAILHDDLTAAWALSCGLGFLADRQGQNHEMARVFDLGVTRLRADHDAQRGAPDQQRARATLLAALLANRCERLCRIGQLGDTAACLQEAEGLLAAADSDDAQWAEARWFCGRMAAWTSYERGDFAGSMRQCRKLQAEIQARRVQIWPYGEDSLTIWLTEVNELLGFNALALGEYEEARRLAIEGMDIAQQQDLPYCRAWSTYPLIGALLSLGEYVQAEEVAQRFVHEARAFADDLMITQATAMLGHAQAATGQHGRARATLRQALTLARRSGLRVIITGCLVGLGDLELAAGRLAAARRLYEETFGAAQPGANEPWRPPAALVGLGRVALSQGRRDDALAHFRQALSAPAQNAATAADALVYAAETLAQQGDLALFAEVCGFMLNWPGAPYGVKEMVRKLVAALAGHIQPEELAMALEL